MDIRRITEARQRLSRHMRGSGYDMAQDKLDVRMWSTEPLVVLDLVTHRECGQCYGILSELHRCGLYNVRYESE